ncbi:MAG: zf-HC2 domain-containing protein [Candidatus Syntrophosphaera sp.]
MRCNKAKHWIELKLDGELGESHVRALEEHLTKCAPCRRYQKEALELKRMFQADEQPEFPAWLHHQIMDKAARQDKQRVSLKHRWKLQAIPAFLAVVIALTFGVLIGKNAYGTVRPPSYESHALNDVQQSSQHLASFGESSIVDPTSFEGEIQ